MTQDYYDYYEESEDDAEQYAIRPNKTQLKKDIAELFVLGEKLSRISATQLATLTIPDAIQQAIREVSGMPLNSARKRLLKYIAGQLHKIDCDPIKESLAKLENKSVHAAREHHQVERWRDRLLAEGDKALTELLDEYPDVDRQYLRQLLRTAQKELAASAPPRASRLLYRYLKTVLEGESHFDDAEDDEDIDADEQDDS
ncbi:MAG: ribosome biogenesis factor YjgA [Methylovulum sp.]|jgi:ribosome-associated protein